MTAKKMTTNEVLAYLALGWLAFFLVAYAMFVSATL